MLDWELSTLGDPLADFSYHLMQWHMPPSDAGTGSLVGHDLAALGIPSLDAYVDAYVARTGLDPRPHLPVYFAYNFFRLAAILQGIAGRVRDGTATSAFAAAKAELVRPLAAKAWEFAQRAGRRMKTFALALGGGGARGLAHIACIEALDEMGVRPAAIAGTSIGALIGAAYAAGMRGKDIRRHVIALAHNRGEIMRRLIAARAGTLADLFTGAFGQATQLDAEKFCAQFLPEAVPEDFAALANSADRRWRPICTAAQEAAFTSGPLQPALAASIAHAGPVAAGRDRRPHPDRRRRHQSAAVRSAARARRRHRRGRHLRRAGRGARRHAERLGKPVHDGAGHGQRHRRREAQARRARSRDPAQCRRSSARSISIRRAPSCAPPSR